MKRTCLINTKEDEKGIAGQARNNRAVVLTLMMCFAFLNTLFAQNDSPLKTTYLAPTRIVWKSTGDESVIKNEQALLKPGTGQADLANRDVCVLKSGELEFPGIVLDFGKEIQGGLQIVAASSGKIRIRFGESVSEVMHDVGEKGSTNDHAIRDEILVLPWLGVNETGNTGFRFVRIDFLDKKA
jgi:hypothetical protein